MRRSRISIRSIACVPTVIAALAAATTHASERGNAMEHGHVTLLGTGPSFLANPHVKAARLGDRRAWLRIEQRRARPAGEMRRRVPFPPGSG